MTKLHINRLRKAVKPVLLAASCICYSYAAIAVTQGSLGPDSTGIVGIEVDKPAQARITGLSDMTLASWVIGDGDKTLHTDACIYTTSGAYTVVATGSGASSAFTLTDGVDGTALHTVPYTVKWDDAGAGAIGGGPGTSLTAADAPAPFSNASVVSATCATGSPAGPNARINIGLTEANLVQLASGTFTGTLTLLVAPN